MPTPFAGREAVSGTPLGEAWPGSPESQARGMLTKGFPVNRGELPASLQAGPGGAQPKDARSPGGQGCPREKRTSLKRSLLRTRETGGAGKGRQGQARASEQSYESSMGDLATTAPAPKLPFAGSSTQVPEKSAAPKASGLAIAKAGRAARTTFRIMCAPWRQEESATELLGGNGDVFGKDQAEDDVLVLRRVHVVSGNRTRIQGSAYECANPCSC